MNRSVGFFLLIAFLTSCPPSGKQGPEEEAAGALGKRNEAAIDQYRMAIENKDYAYHSSYRVEDGKIKTRASNLNVSDVLSQTGYKFAAPANREVLTQ